MKDTSRQQETMDQTMAELQAMCRQESNGYVCRNYLRSLHHENATVGNDLMRSPSPDSVHIIESECSTPSLPRLPLHLQEVPAENVDFCFTVEDRSVLVQYGYRVADFCQCPREVVAIAMNYFDRYLGSPRGLQWWTMELPPSQRGSFLNLVMMTALYTAMKLHAPSALSSSTMALLSRGRFTTEQVEYMERVLAETLGWRLNPPTALAFVRQMMDLIPANLLDPHRKDAVYDVARLQIEMALDDYTFIDTPASLLAYSAIQVALQSMAAHSATVAACYDQIEVSIMQAVDIDNISLVLSTAMSTIHENDWETYSLDLEDLQEKLCIGIVSYLRHPGDDILEKEIAPKDYPHQTQIQRKDPAFQPTIRSAYGEAAVA